MSTFGQGYKKFSFPSGGFVLGWLILFIWCFVAQTNLNLWQSSCLSPLSIVITNMQHDWDRSSVPPHCGDFAVLCHVWGVSMVTNGWSLRSLCSEWFRCSYCLLPRVTIAQGGQQVSESGQLTVGGRCCVPWLPTPSLLSLSNSGKPCLSCPCHSACTLALCF